MEMRSTSALLCCLLCLAALLPGDTAITDGTGDGMELWGYVKVRPKANMFWWYFRSPQRVSSPAKPWPTILWLQGGPGVSGVGHGNFLEIGPLDANLNQRNSTWLQKADLIFVDSPVGVGYSYVEDPSAMAKTDLQSALDVVELLNALSKEIPTLESSPLFLVGESYGGKLAAMIGVSVIKAINAGTLKLKLGGVVLGDSWISPDDYALSYPWLLQGMSRLDDNAVGDAIRMGMTLKQQMVVGQFTAAFKTFTDLRDWIDKKSGNVNMEDTRLDATVSSVLSDFVARSNTNTIISDIMNGVIKEKLKIIPKNVTWQDVSLQVYYALTGEFMKPSIHEVDDLLSNGVNVTVYNGQFDMICSTFGTEAWVRRLKWHGLQNFLSLPREPLFYCQPYALTNGFVRSYQNFNFYWILGAGHMVVNFLIQMSILYYSMTKLKICVVYCPQVPLDQPCTALYMISDIVQSP